MMRRILQYVLVVFAVLGASALGPPASAYVVPNTCSVNAPSTGGGGQAFTLTDTCVQPNGNPVPAGTPVTFSQASGPTASTTCQASFNPVTANADGGGSASTTVTLPPGCPGQYVLLVSAAGFGSGSVTVTETGDGFPNTSGDRGGHSWSSWWLALLAGPVLLGLGLWRRAAFMRTSRTR